MIRTQPLAGRATLCVAHCAGLVDLVALPLWMGALIQHYRFDSQQAGLLVTLFLAGGMLAMPGRCAQFPPIHIRMLAGFNVAV